MQNRPLLLALLAALFVAAAAAAPAARAADAGAWNRGDQRAVVKDGLMVEAADGRFHGGRSLGVAGMRRALEGIAARRGVEPLSVPAGALTVQRFHALLIRQLGLAEPAAQFRSEARRSSLRPPRRFGTEVAARLLGLRYNHPAREDRLELFPWDPITRAEAAYSLARARRLGEEEATYLSAVAERFVLPRYDARQRRALRVAVSRIGMPYVWGGESDGLAASAYGAQAQGGYDCSGFVWRVFKLTGNPAGARIGGRTAAQMAGEIPRPSRVLASRVRPADLLFFGAAGFRSRATERSVTHLGLALSPDFMIHSADQGVYVSPLGEWADSFAWARRVL